MVTISAERLTSSKVISIESRRQMGALGLDGYIKGSDDSLSHVIDFIKYGETVMPGIEEDIVTELAERIKHPLINHVEFGYANGDFVSVKDKRSMKDMIKGFMLFMQAEVIYDPKKQQEYDRAVAEYEEVKKLVEWFDTADTQTYLVFESLPIGDQTEAVTRIYQKTANGRLRSSFIRLFNPTVEQFNDLRSEFCVDGQKCSTPLEFLQNSYEFQMPNGLEYEFVDYYRGLYDTLMTERGNSNFHFGKEIEPGEEIIDGIERIRLYPQLASIYIETIKTLVASEGSMTSDLLGLTRKLGIDINLRQGDSISVPVMKSILDEAKSWIASAYDRADKKLLEDLSKPDVSDSASYQIVALYGGQARSEGVSYSTGSCPTFSSSQNGLDAGSESNILFRSFNIYNEYKGLKNFGEAKMDVCRTRNCLTSRKNPNKLPERVVVGGCGFCVDCHMLLSHDKDPERHYAELIRQKKLEEEKRIKRKKRENERVAEEVRIEELRRRKKVAAKIQQEKSIQQNSIKLSTG